MILFSIQIDDEELYNQTRIICKKLHLQNNQLLSFINQMIHPFLKYNIERQIKTSFGKTVSMSKGAYLIIEHTEALHVIDVNSGNRSNKASNQEDTAMEVNMIAAAEIARQLRLRDMGGIIVIDFIDLSNPENRKILFDFGRNERTMIKRNTRSYLVNLD
jgi:ribonuclease G